jgi:very-short-patch-repair endonuclease
MNSIYYDVWRRGGVAATHELLRDGHTSHALTRAVRRGEVIRARQGHYCTPELDPAQVRALRVGGRLSGLAAARAHGLWTPKRAELRVAVGPNARALRAPDDARKRLNERPAGAVAWWADPASGGTRSLVSPLACLVDVAAQHPPLIAFAVVESALHAGLVSESTWQRAVQAMPRTIRLPLIPAGRLSESGGESQLRFQLLAMGVELRQQVPMSGVGRIDFLIGDGLVVEADGAEFHTGRDDFEEDRRRDAVLAARGYRVLRFSYTQIVERWPEVEAAIRAAIARGDHLRTMPLPA